MTRRRTLHPEEYEIWATVARTAKALPGRDSFPTVPEVVKIPEQVIPTAIKPFRIGGAKSVALPTQKSSLQFSDNSLRMDVKTFAKMSRGKLKPESRIDLHGMTLDQAHSALISYVFSCHNKGLRLILVITGKGKNSLDSFAGFGLNKGILRHQVPRWLAMPPLSSAVLQVTVAHVTHGGGGALYVYLRRR